MRGVSVLICAISASARMSVQENRRATKRSKEAAQGSKMLSPRAFAVKCRQMPGGCGGKMAKRLWRAVQQKTSIHRASPSPSPPPPPPLFVVEHTRIRSPVGLSVSTSVAAGVRGPPWQLEEHLGKAGCDNASGLQRSPHLVFVVVGVEKSGALCR